MSRSGTIGRARNQLSDTASDLLVDFIKPNVGRMNDYMLDGKDNSTGDRAVDKMIAEEPALPILAKANHAFLGRAVRYLMDGGKLLRILLALVPRNQVPVSRSDMSATTGMNTLSSSTTLPRV